MVQKQNNTYTSCYWVESGFEFSGNRLRTCCFEYLQDREEPNCLLIENYNGEKINWEVIKEHKRKRRELHKKNLFPKPCKGCVYLFEKDWDEDFYIDHLTFNHWEHCNCNCTYCYPKDEELITPYDILPVLQDMLERKILKATPTSCITFGGGEPTILENFDKIIDLLLENGFYNIRINSSGIKYSKSIEKGLRMGVISLVISTDSGSKEMYEKIKRVKCFDIVWNNIKKYAANQKERNLVKVKYIIIPGVNDSFEEIDKWFELVLKNNVKSVSVSMEGSWYQETFPDFPKEVYDKILYVENKAQELGLDMELYIEALSLKKKYEEGINN